MDERKRHIVEDYPAEQLPPELRGDIDPSHHARVIVEDTGSEVPAKSGWRKHFGAAAYRNTSIEEAVARIRELRDEWEK